LNAEPDLDPGQCRYVKVRTKLSPGRHAFLGAQR
jgi:hypothetical protein